MMAEAGNGGGGAAGGGGGGGNGTVKVPLIGKMKKTHAYALGAVGAGIIGYAWFMRARGVESAPGPEEALEEGDPYYTEIEGMDDGTPWPYRPGGNSVVSENPVVDPETLPPKTNQEWSRRAYAVLTEAGWEPRVVQEALGRYLGRQGLNKTHESIIRAAIGMIGPPPVGDFPVWYDPKIPDVPKDPDPTDPDPTDPDPTDPDPKPGNPKPPSTTYKGPAVRKKTWAGKGTGPNANTHVYPNLGSWGEVYAYYYDNRAPNQTIRDQHVAALQRYNSNKPMKKGMLVYLKATLP